MQTQQENKREEETSAHTGWVPDLSGKRQELIKLQKAGLCEETSRIGHQELYLISSFPLHIGPRILLLIVNFRI